MRESSLYFEATLTVECFDRVHDFSISLHRISHKNLRKALGIWLHQSCIKDLTVIWADFALVSTVFKIANELLVSRCDGSLSLANSKTRSQWHLLMLTKIAGLIQRRLLFILLRFIFFFLFLFGDIRYRGIFVRFLVLSMRNAA